MIIIIITKNVNVHLHYNNYIFHIYTDVDNHEKIYMHTDIHAYIQTFICRSVVGTCVVMNAYARKWMHINHHIIYTHIPQNDENTVCIRVHVRVCINTWIKTTQSHSIDTEYTRQVYTDYYLQLCIYLIFNITVTL